MAVVKSIYNFLEHVGRVRACTYFAHKGDYASAERVLLDEFKGWI